jgi:hypothetical protein
MKQLRAHWMPILAGLALLAGLGYWWLSRAALEPAEGARTFYPAVMLYNYTAATCATTLGLAALLAVTLAVPQALRRAPQGAFRVGLALLALVGAALVCYANVPQWFVHYRHIDRAAWNGQVAQLGVRLALDGDNYFVLCACSPPGWVCQCRRLTEAGVVADLAARPELDVEAATGLLVIRVGSETVWSGTP